MDKREKNSKNKIIKIIVICSFLVFIVTVSIVMINQKKKFKETTKHYSVETLRISEPLIFNGVVQPLKTENFPFDQSKGTLIAILVKNGQQIKANTPLLTYQNDTIQQQIVQEKQQLEKLKLAVTVAQQNLDRAYDKKKKLEENDQSSANEPSPTDESSPSNITESPTKSVYEDAIDAQNEVIWQNQQALDTATLDLNTMNQNIEKDKSKVTSTVNASIDGITLVDENGKTTSTTPLVRVVSKDTIVEGKVSEYDYAQIIKNRKVTILPSSSDQKVDGTIIEVNKLPDNANMSSKSLTSDTPEPSTTTEYSFKVKPDHSLQYGYNCQITLSTNEIKISKNSIMTDEIGQYVYIFEDGKSRKVRITTKKKDNLYIVTNGLKEKQQIISNPDKMLKNGQKVSVKR